MPRGYGSHADYMLWVKSDADHRQALIEQALRQGFSDFIERRDVDVVVFSGMSALSLSKAILAQPLVLKALLASCNIAARAIERDLGIKNVDTYSPRVSRDEAKVLAGYIKPFLPAYLEIPTLACIDRVAFIDKEIRKGKGRWERKIVEALNSFARLRFRKRSFTVGGERFELDAAAPPSGDIELGIDVKRIEARRDIHKRCDEIVNKAAKLKAAFPMSKFGAVVYYPFIDEQVNIQNRLRSGNIDSIVFASQEDESIENAVRMLLSILRGSRK
jgi:hypothetical protein